MDDERVPESVQDALRLVAEWLDAADEAFTLIAELNGKVRYPDGQDACQKSMRALADWFDARPLAAYAAWEGIKHAADFTVETRIEPVGGS